MANPNAFHASRSSLPPAATTRSGSSSCSADAQWMASYRAVRAGRRLRPRAGPVPHPPRRCRIVARARPVAVGTTRTPGRPGAPYDAPVRVRPPFPHTAACSTHGVGVVPESATCFAARLADRQRYESRRIDVSDHRRCSSMSSLTEPSPRIGTGAGCFFCRAACTRPSGRSCSSRVGRPTGTMRATGCPWSPYGRRPQGLTAVVRGVLRPTPRRHPQMASLSTHQPLFERRNGWRVLKDGRELSTGRAEGTAGERGRTVISRR